MKQFIRKIKQHFCCHYYNDSTPKHTTPFLGWMFQCSKCGGYVAYFKEWDEFVDISEEKYLLYKEEGEKLHGIGFFNKEEDKECILNSL